MSKQDEISSSVIVFYSYAHEDEALRSELEKHLSGLRREGLITEWYDRQIVPGTDWVQSIDTHLMTASIILLLISSDFLASDYCYSIEMRQAMKRHYDGNARVIPIILRPADWQEAPFSRLQVLPTDAKPVTTWNNRDEAFLDIANGIRKAVEDLQATSAIRKSIENLPIQQPVLPLWTVPYRRNPFFTGREDIIRQLHERLTTARVALSQPQAVSGLGGIGKTQIVIEYVYRYRDDYDSVFWIRADTKETLLLDFATTARFLELPEKDIEDPSSVINNVINWLEGHVRWLVIFDNADDLSVLDGTLPKRSSGHIIITTRSQATGSIATGIEVEKMPVEQGALFLLRRAKVIEPDVSLDKVLKTNRVNAEDISKAMDGHALALEQAGAYIEEIGCSLSAYLDLYQKHSNVLLRRQSRHAQEHPQPVTTTFLLCFQRVEKANRAAADLLRLLAFLPEPDVISEELIKDKFCRAKFDLFSPRLWLKRLMTDPFLWNASIEELLKYSLVRRNPAKKTLSIHRLLQVVIRDEIDVTARRQWSALASLVGPVTLSKDTVFETLNRMVGDEDLIENQIGFSLLEDSTSDKTHYKYRLIIGIFDTKNNQVLKNDVFNLDVLDDDLAQLHSEHRLVIYT